MNKQLIAWINENLGYSISDKYYSKIDVWLDWWRGYCKPFHRFSYSNGKKRIERDLYTLKMGKKVCEDWASILLNSKTHIKISDEQTNIFVWAARDRGYPRREQLLDKGQPSDRACVCHGNGSGHDPRVGN